MKLITLNIWGGKVGKTLLDFFIKYKDIDVFVLQEVFHNATDITAWDENDRREVFSEIADILPEHNAHYAAAESDEWGLAAFVNKNFSVDEVGDIFVHGKKNSLIGRDGTTLGKNIQYIKLSEPWRGTVINFHGLWNGNGKTDTVDRLNQSKRIADFITSLEGDVVLAGDFNLRPDTKSLRILDEELGLRNLVLEHNITSTRTSHYKKAEKFADYILVSPAVQVKHFKVLPDEVSDHAPLLIDFL